MEENMSKKIEWLNFLEEVANFTGTEVKDLSESTTIYDELGMDSLGLFSLGMHLIKEYCAKIPLSALATIETINDMYILLNDGGKKGVY
jgi:acyl carrier protein